jgi:hypothetical protein
MMQLIKAIFGGIVGGAIGTAVYYYLNPATPAALPWVAILTGLLTGVGVRIFCGSGRSFLTGVVALAMTVLMLLGWPVARDMQSLMSNSSDLGKPLNVVKSSASVDPGSDKKSDGAEDGSSEDSDAASTSEDEPSEGESDESKLEGSPNSSDMEAVESEAPSIANGPAATAPVKPSFFNFDPKQTNEGIAFGLAGLLAFVLGTGKGSRSLHSDREENSKA